VPADLRNAYRKDVTDLAAKRLLQTQSPDAVRIAVPPVHTDSIWSAMASVFHTGTQIEADSVFRQHCIHLYSRWYSEDSIHVRCDTTQAWARAWRDGLPTTGNAFIDGLKTQYGIGVDSIYTYPGYEEIFDVKLHTPLPVNTNALKDSLLTVPGIYSAGSFQTAGDGDWIGYEVDTVQRLTFVRGWGDCPLGCTEDIVWRYAVGANCSVTYTGKTESIWHDWPYLRGCDLQPLAIAPDPAKAALAVYPNPAGQFIMVTTSVYPAACTIRNTLGQQMLSRPVTGPSTRIDLEQLPPGLYTVRITGAQTGAGVTFLKR
jgi:hypothetical protein